MRHHADRDLFRREVKNIDNSLIEYDQLLVSVEHAKALGHVSQRGIESLSLIYWLHQRVAEWLIARWRVQFRARAQMVCLFQGIPEHLHRREHLSDLVAAIAMTEVDICLAE